VPEKAVKAALPAPWVWRWTSYCCCWEAHDPQCWCDSQTLQLTNHCNTTLLTSESRSDPGQMAPSANKANSPSRCGQQKMPSPLLKSLSVGIRNYKYGMVLRHSIPIPALNSIVKYAQPMPKLSQAFTPIKMRRRTFSLLPFGLDSDPIGLRTKIPLPSTPRGGFFGRHRGCREVELTPGQPCSATWANRPFPSHWETLNFST
jgi:hypothetical protein